MSPRVIIILQLSSILYLGNSQASAQISTSGAAACADWLDFLAQISRYSPLEGADSHGSSGLVVVVGGSRNEIASAGSVVQRELDLDDAAEQGTNIDMPRAWVVKGLPWPVDVGLGAGTLMNSNLSLLAGHLQWSVYEALAMPALAVRINYGKVFGLKHTAFTMTGADLVASYGFLRYFNIYGAYGVAQNNGSVTVDESSEYSFMLADFNEGGHFTRTEITSSYLYGAKITIMPPFVAVALESQSAPNDTKQYLAKLSVAL